MQQLFQAPQALLCEWKQRATDKCLRFPKQEMPPGTDPPKASVGIEIDSRSGAATLLVEKGVRYRGEHPQVREWLEQGRLQFPSFEALCSWLRSELEPLYKKLAAKPPSDETTPAPGEPTSDCILPLVGREDLLEEINLCLQLQAQPVAVVLVGRSGAGKTAICREVASRWKNNGQGTVQWPELPALLAGVAMPGESQQRMQYLLEGAVRLGSSGLLVLEAIHLTCGTERVAWGGLEAERRKRLVPDTAICLGLCSAIDAGLKIVGTTSPRGLSALRQPALMRRLEIIELSEPTDEQMAGAILPAVADCLQRHYDVETTPESLRLVLHRSRELPGAQPGKAIRMLERAVVQARVRGLAVLGPDDVLP